MKRKIFFPIAFIIVFAIGFFIGYFHVIYDSFLYNENNSFFIEIDGNIYEKIFD